MQDGTYIKFNAHTMPVTPIDGYTVATNSIAVLSTPSEVETYVAAHVRGGYAFGVWTDSKDGAVYLDYVTVTPSLADALDMARKRGELAIWDNANSTEIRVTYCERVA